MSKEQIKQEINDNIKYNRLKNVDSFTLNPILNDIVDEMATAGPIAEYVHNSNLVANIQSIDYITGTFTSPNHGITGTGRIHAFVVLKNNAGVDGTVDFLSKVPTAINNLMFYIYTPSLTSDTFQLTTSNNGLGTPITMTDSGTVDLSKWHIETSRNEILTISNINQSIFNFEIIGKIYGANYIFVGGTGIPNQGLVNNYISSINNNGVPSTVLSRFNANLGKGSIYTTCNGSVNLLNGIEIKTISEALGYHTSSPFFTYNKIETFRKSAVAESKTYIADSFILSGVMAITNGTKIRIYKP